MTLVDREAHRRWKGLVLQHPALADAVDVVLLEVDVESPDEEALEILRARVAEAGPDRWR